MASFNSACLTKKGMALLAKAQVEQAVIEFTKAATGNGEYTEEDILVDMEALKVQQQEFPISTISIVDNATVYLKFIVSNYHGDVALLEGYHVTEVGIFAEDPDEGEILYAIATAIQDQSDYLPEYNNLLPSTITMEFYATVANAAEVFIKAKSGAYVYQEDFDNYKREIHAELQSVKNPVFEDYTESEFPEPETALEEIVSGKPIDIIHQYTKASLTGILTVAKKALNIALGRNQARVFATVADLDAWLAVPANVQKLNVGDNFYIIATDVPDYWWDGNQKQKLETQKVDLTTYDQRITANASAISELNGNFEKTRYAITSVPNAIFGSVGLKAYKQNGLLYISYTGHTYAYMESNSFYDVGMILGLNRADRIMAAAAINSSSPNVFPSPVAVRVSNGENAMVTIFTGDDISGKSYNYLNFSICIPV